MTEDEVYERRKALGIRRSYKMVDTCAAEFPAATPYYYSTFEEENESVASDKEDHRTGLRSEPDRTGDRV